VRICPVVRRGRRLVDVAAITGPKLPIRPEIRRRLAVRSPEVRSHLTARSCAAVSGAGDKLSVRIRIQQPVLQVGDRP